MVEPEHIELAVVGGGPIGAAAARHAAERGIEVVLVAAPRGTGDRALYSSHDDAARITRVLDGNRIWARMAKAAIARYRDIERRSGITFYDERGCVVLGEGSGAASSVAGFVDVASELDIHHDVLDADDLRAMPFGMTVSDDAIGLWQRLDAGVVAPLRMVGAQRACAQGAGAVLVDDRVVVREDGRDGTLLRTLGGREIVARRVVLALGPYAAMPGLIDATPAVGWVQPRTVALARVGEREAERLREMPALLSKPQDPSANCYVVPPVRYDDGEMYVKVGGGPEGAPIRTGEELDAWFRGGGDPGEAERVQGLLRSLLPDLEVEDWTQLACVVTRTGSGQPALAPIAPGVVAVVGGNGHAAKSGDELGRLAMVSLFGGDGRPEAGTPSHAPR